MKKTFKFNKLIRDRLHQKMVDQGIQVNCKQLSNEQESLEYFKAKIIEEANEVISSTSKEEMMEELADVLEVIQGFCKLLNIHFEEIENIRSNKQEIKGGFTNAIVVDTVCLDEDHEFAKYYLSNSEKYPLVNDQ